MEERNHFSGIFSRKELIIIIDQQFCEWKRDLFGMVSENVIRTQSLGDPRGWKGHHLNHLKFDDPTLDIQKVWFLVIGKPILFKRCFFSLNRKPTGWVSIAYNPKRFHFQGWLVTKQVQTALKIDQFLLQKQIETWFLGSVIQSKSPKESFWCSHHFFPFVWLRRVSERSYWFHSKPKGTPFFWMKGVLGPFFLFRFGGSNFTPQKKSSRESTF